MLDLAKLIPETHIKDYALTTEWLAQNVSLVDQQLYWLIACVLEKPGQLSAPGVIKMIDKNYKYFYDVLFSVEVELEDLVRICKSLEKIVIEEEKPKKYIIADLNTL